LLQDLYGNAAAGAFISALSRLLTYYLQMHGFTCSYDDLLLVPEAEEQRRIMLETAETAALNASARFVGEEVPQLLQGGQESGGPLRQSLVPVSSCPLIVFSRYATNTCTSRAYLAAFRGESGYLCVPRKQLQL